MRVKQLVFVAVRCCTLLAISASFAMSAPFHYNEAISGDLSVYGAPLTTFGFGIGENTVSGRVGRDVGVVDDFDSFAFIVPPGAQLIAGQISMSDYEGDLLYAYWELFAGSANWNTGSKLGGYSVDSPGAIPLATPLGTGVYNFSHILLSFQDFPPSTADYLFTFTLVPEPPAIALTGFGLFAVLLIRRHFRPLPAPA
jgi:hypothetical protein